MATALLVAGCDVGSPPPAQPTPTILLPSPATPDIRIPSPSPVRPPQTPPAGAPAPD
jgi:hypothetical protein